MKQKRVYDLISLKKYFGFDGDSEEEFFFWWTKNILAKGKYFSFAWRCIDDTPQSKGTEYYTDKAQFIGRETNTIGPYGDSDFWEYGNDGNIYSTETPTTDIDVFIDGAYNVAVVYL